MTGPIGGAFSAGARISAATAGAAIANTVATLNRIRFMGIPRFLSTTLIPQEGSLRCYCTDTGDNYRQGLEDGEDDLIRGYYAVKTIRCVRRRNPAREPGRASATSPFDEKTVSSDGEPAKTSPYSKKSPR